MEKMAGVRRFVMFPSTIFQYNTLKMFRPNHNTNRDEEESTMSDNPLTNKTFEEAYAELEKIVQELESGGLTLDRSLTLYEEGQKLAAYCQHLLENAELRVSELGENGTLASFRLSEE